MPRAALLSIHARVAGAGPSSWEDASLVQLWGPRFQVYVIAARDLAVFSLGRFPDDLKGRRRAEDMAARLHALLDGATMPYGAAGDALGLHDANALRYAATTGTVLIRWAGARQPTVWTVPSTGDDPLKARLELARRHLHVFGPSTPESFARLGGDLSSGRRDSIRFAAALADRGSHADRRCVDPGPRRAGVPRRPRARRHRRGCCRAAMPSTCCRGTTVTARPGRRSSQRAVDVAGMARRRAARGRGQRHLAAGERDGDDPGLAPPFPRCTPGR